MEFLIQDFFLSLTSVMVQLELLTCFSECGYKKKKKSYAVMKKFWQLKYMMIPRAYFRAAPWTGKEQPYSFVKNFSSVSGNRSF